MNANITIEEHLGGTRKERKFTVTFFGTPIRTTVTYFSSVVKTWIKRVLFFYRFHRYRLIVGLGVQWPPISIRGKQARAATLQLCIGRHCLIFQVRYRNLIPNALKSFLKDPNITFVGVRNGEDARLLRRDHGLSVTTKDLLFLAETLGYGGESMEKLASAVLGFHGVEKPERVGRSYWDDRHLSLEQVQYACVDAHVSFEIGKALKAWKW